MFAISSQRSPVTTLSDLYMKPDEAADLVTAITSNDAETELLGETVNLVNIFKNPVRIDRIEGLPPANMRQVEEYLDRKHGCIETGFLHVNRALYERVEIGEAIAAREEREDRFKAVKDLKYEYRPDRKMLDNAVILPGISSQELAMRISIEAGIPLGSVAFKEFANGDMSVDVRYNVRRQRVFIVQTFSHETSKQIDVMEQIMAAVRMSSAAEINLVMPLLPYAREDRKSNLKRSTITCAVHAVNFVQQGMDRAITLDVHSEQSIGFFKQRPVDNLYAIPLAAKQAILDNSGKKLAFVAADQGMVKRLHDNDTMAMLYRQAGRRDIPLLHINKFKIDGEIEKIELYGDLAAIEGATCILLDDMIDTAGTNVKGGSLIKKYRAAEVISIAAHPVFSRDGIEKIKYSMCEGPNGPVRAIDKVYVVNTAPIHKSLRDITTGMEIIKIVDCAPLIGEAVRRLAQDDGESFRDLLNSKYYFNGTH